MKSKISDLGLLGGPPTFAQTLHVGRPNIGARAAFQARMDDIFNRGWLTNNGTYVLTAVTATTLTVSGTPLTVEAWGTTTIALDPIEVAR